MGQRGPQRKPTHLLNDEYYKKSREGELTYEHQKLHQKTLEEFKTEDQSWDNLVDLLNEYGVTTVADSAALSLLKDTWDDYQEALALCKTDGRYITTNSGYSQLAPWTTQANKMREQVLKILKEFGLTPSSRAGLLVHNQGSKKAEPDNPLDI